MEGEILPFFMHVNTICILGGGTSGFTVASILARYREVSGLNFSIKLVYSKDIGTIGVGESTLLSINDLFNYLNIKDSEWMKECNATYKTSIRFEDFNKGTYFQYPFGDIDPRRSNASGIRQWFISKEVDSEVFSPERASLYFLPHTILAERNKLTRDGIDGFDFDRNTAYQFDAHKLGNYLRKYAEGLGVEVIDDRFIGSLRDENGFLTDLVCKDGTYDADLFIDCSGFKSLLLGGELKEEYISFKDTSINNKALRAKIPYTNKEEQLKSYTNCVALENGWCWEIPLWDGMSLGYVHSDKFATEEEIKREFVNRYGNIDCELIEFKSGVYERGWVKNVIGVGLSYGFIEPLEGTGIATTLDNSFRMLECLSKRDMNYTSIDRDLFNYSIKKRMYSYRGLLDMHYYLSTRDDSKYWRHVTNEIDYAYDDDPFSMYNQFCVDTMIRRDYSQLNTTAGALFIVTGMNYSCFSSAITQAEISIDNNILLDSNTTLFKDYLKSLEDRVKELPSTFNFLSNHIYGEENND